MKSLFAKSVLLFLVILQISSLVVIDDHHLEDVLGIPNAQQQITSHDCGSKELHKDIPHYCLGCLRNANFSFVVSSPSLPCIGQSLRPVKFYSSATVRLTDFYISASKRGPPLSIS